MIGITDSPEWSERRPYTDGEKESKNSENRVFNLKTASLSVAPTSDILK